MFTSDVVIIGAGPYGLSLSAHLTALNVPHRILGKPMDTWRTHCPEGMQLRSEPYGSSIAAPADGFDVRSFCALSGRPYEDRLGPLSLTDFMDYADWFTEQLVPGVEELTVTNLEPVGNGFRTTTSEGQVFDAGTVVIAVGMLPFAKLPEQLEGLPVNLATLASDHHDLSRFSGQRVAVVGGGQSASEVAALLAEGGAEVQLLTRGDGINWLEPNPQRVGGLLRLARPVNNLCEGWHCAFWYSPLLFRRLPQEIRSRKARSVLGPAGAWWLKDRVEGRVTIRRHTTIGRAEPTQRGLRLLLQAPAGESVEFFDHAIAATGYCADVGSLPWLDPAVRADLVAHAGFPRLRRSGESSVRGLFFAGALAAGSLGPSARFVAGTHTTVRQMARAIAHRQTGVGASGALHEAPAGADVSMS